MVLSFLNQSIYYSLFLYTHNNRVCIFNAIKILIQSNLIPCFYCYSFILYFVTCSPALRTVRSSSLFILIRFDGIFIFIVTKWLTIYRIPILNSYFLFVYSNDKGRRKARDMRNARDPEKSIDG